jgi:type III secretion protein C
MQHFFPRIAKSTLIEAALGLVLLHAPLLCEDPPTPEDAVGFLFSSGKVKKIPGDDQVPHNTPSFKGLDKKTDTYTINFSNISIIEYIKFASKITTLNFVFNDDELQFNVTVVSEEPVTPRNIMSILIQVLRINGLVVLEQDNNLLITKVRNVSQLATVVASDLPAVHSNAPLVTRVFRIKNANLNTVASVIKPMMSDSALLEVSAETKQLIITDITTNVDKISSLLASIDAPHSPLEIDSYVAKSSDLDGLIKLATQIVSPFSEGNVLTFVPQVDTQTIFIISTPFLIERTMTVLEDLETSNKSADQLAMKGQTVYLYKLQYKRGDEFITELDDLSKQLNKRGASEKLVDCLEEAKWIKESNSILFIGDDQTLTKVKELIPTLDTPVAVGSMQKSNFYVYKIQQAPYEQLENSIDAMAENLQKAPKPDYALIEVLTTFKYIPDANSLVFTGDTAALSKLAEILPSFDVSSNQSTSSQFLIYNPKNRTGEQLEKSIQEIAKNLKTAGLADPHFLQSVQSVKWTPSNNSLIFTGTPDTLTRIQSILVSLDGGTEGVGGGVGGQTFYLYKLQNANGNTVIDSLKKVSSNLNDSNIPNQALIATLRNIKWIKENNSLLLTGSNTAIEQARTLIEQFDVPAATNSPEANKSAFFIYKPIHQKPQALQSDIQTMSKDLEGSGLVDPDLLLTLNTMRYVASTDSLLFTGSPDSIEKVKEILTRTDVISPQEGQIQQLGESTFLIYKIQSTPSAQLITSLKNLTSDLQRSGPSDQAVAISINNLKYIKDTNSILFTGTPDTLKKLETILKKFDAGAGGNTSTTPSTFIVYTPKHVPGDELIQILSDFEQNLVASGVANKSLFDTIGNLKYVARTCSLIISGDQESIAKVEELLRRFDVPASTGGKIPASIESIQNTSFLIYKLEYHQGDEILSALKQIATDLGTGTATGNQNLLNAINSLQWIRVTNSLLASGEAETLSKLRDLIVNLDIPLRQVFIEVLLIQTSLSNTQNFGLQWGGKLQYLNRVAAGSGNFPNGSTSPAATSNPVNPANPNGYQTLNTNTSLPSVNAGTTPTAPMIPFTSGFDLGVIGDIIMHKGRSFLSLGSLVNALQLDTDSTVVLNPKIITQDNRTSTLFVGNNIPFIGSQVTSQSTIFTSSSNIEYRDVGFNLTITPTIGNSNVVTLDISNDISQVLSSPLIGTNSTSSSGSTGGVAGIESSHTTMATRVHVPDKHFVVLSGMIQDTKSRYKSAIPCLGGLPVIGAIFSENDRNDTKVNLIIFLRPQIINTYDDYKKITDEQECLYKDQAVMPVLKEEFDAGIDVVKRPDDE